MGAKALSDMSRPARGRRFARGVLGFVMEHLDGLVLVPDRRWPARSRTLAQPADVRPDPEPRQGRRAPASSSSGHVSLSGCRSRSGDPPAAPTRTAPWQRDVKDGTIGRHAEPPGTAGIWSDLLTGAPRFPSDLRLCPRACPCDRYVRNAGFTLAEKTSLLFLEWQIVPS